MTDEEKDNKVLNYHIWTDDIHGNILSDIKKYQPDIVNIFAAEEHEINGLWSGIDGYKKYITPFIENNIEVNFIFGAASKEFYVNRYNFPDNKIYVHLWPTYFLCFVLSSIYNNNGFDEIIPARNFKYPFISLNNRPHNHRCLFIDLLARHDLIDKGIVSWYGENPNYRWRWHKPPKKIVLDEQFLQSGDSYAVPNEWNDSFLHVVSECTIDRIYFSEKTWLPILYCKPFIVQSSKGFYKEFQNLGFKLYDEIFDYSFDNEENDMLRTDAIIQNVKKLIGKDYKKLYRMLKPKILYNFNRAIEIAKSPDFVPSVIKDSTYAVNKYTAVNDVQKRNRNLDVFHHQVNVIMRNL